MPIDEARQRADREWNDLLPGGLDTEGHFLLVIEEADSRQRIGDLWFGRHSDLAGTAFLYDIVVDPHARGRGMGRAAMGLLEKRARELGFTAIQLHVFGDNVVARSLYTAIGYGEISVMMRKELPQAGDAD